MLIITQNQLYEYYYCAPFFKVLLCTEENDDVNVDTDEVEQTSHKKEKKFFFNHGGNVRDFSSDLCRRTSRVLTQTKL